MSSVLIIIIITSIISFNGFKDSSFQSKLLFSPYAIQHRNEYYRLITHIFLHGDPFHLIFNMMSLYFLGEFLEFTLTSPLFYGKITGEIHFLLIYFLGGLFSTLIPFARNKDNVYYRSLGASGAVSSVIFATILWAPTLELNIMFLPIPIPAYIFGPLYLAYEFYADKKGGTGIAHDAHIGGAIFGILYVLIINIDKGKEFLNLIF
jgi:membrane associated rhomboid family serine protease